MPGHKQGGSVSRHVIDHLAPFVDNSSCRLDYALHTRGPGATVVPASLQLTPGSLCFFDGDKLRHRMTPLGAGERRVRLLLNM